MTPCPHCGELIEDDAHACPYCGSDHETGWSPDVEYLSLELPADDDFDAPDEYGHDASDSRRGAWSDESPPGRTRDIAGGVANVTSALSSAFVLFAAFALLVAAGFPAYGWSMLGVAALLGVCLLVDRGARPARGRGRPPAG